MDEWQPKDKAMFPDYFAKREKWYDLRKKTWDAEISWLKEWDRTNIKKVSCFSFTVIIFVVCYYTS